MNKLSLFSGILGDDLASEWAGIETVCCVERDPFCQKIIKKHYPNMPIIGDIKDVTKEKVKEVSGYEWFDIISGGDPCQPRSIAGKRRGREDDRDLWKDMLRVISEFKPTWVVNENPTGRLTMDFHEVLSDLESQGYETRSFVIPACGVNAPHRRDRLFIIAHSDGIRWNEKQNENRITGKEIPQAPSRELSGTVCLSNNITDSDSRRKQQSERGIEESGRRTYDSNQQVNPNSNDSSTARQREHGRGILRESESEGFGVAVANSHAEGLQGFGESGECARELTFAQSTWQKAWFEVATALCGMDDGFSNRVARLKALGNACVPQQVYPIYKAIVEVNL